MNNQVPRRLIIKDIDNRDPTETWLWLCPIGPGRPMFVSVNPEELYRNMIENCFPNYADLLQMILVGETSWDDVREWTVEDFSLRVGDMDMSLDEAECLYSFVQETVFGTEV